MRQYLIVPRIHLILSVINFALAAPLVIRERHEVRVDMVNVAKDGDGTAASQTLLQRVPRDGWFPMGPSEEDWNDLFQGPELSDESDSEPEPSSSGSETGSSHSSPSGSTSSAESHLGSTHAYSSQDEGGGIAPHDDIAEGNQLLLLANAAADANPSSRDHSSPHQTMTVSSSSTDPGLAMLPWAADDPSRSAWDKTLKVPPPILSTTDSGYFYSSDSNSHSTGSVSTGSDYPYSTSSWSTGSNHYSTGSGSTGSDYSYHSMGMGPTGTGHSYSTGSESSYDPPPSNSWDQMPTGDSTGSESLSTKQSPPQSPGQTDNHPPPGPPPNPALSTGPQQSTDSLTPASPEPQSPAEPEPETFLSKLLKGKIKRHT